MTDLSANSASLSKRILLIDDEPDMRRVVQICLEKVVRWTVIAAASAEEGLLKAATEKPDVIVVEIVMLQMDGFMFLDALRAKPETQSIPVVVLTAKAELLLLPQYEALDVNGIVSKPFNSLTLHQEIAAALGWDLDT